MFFCEILVKIAIVVNQFRCPSIMDSAINVASDKHIQQNSETVEVAFS